MPHVASAAFANAEDAGLAAALASGGKGVGDLVPALLLPAAELVAFVDFLIAATLYLPDDALVLATFNQVQDVVATVQSVEALGALQAQTHWAGNASARLVLVDPFRSCVREGDVASVPEG